MTAPRLAVTKDGFLDNSFAVLQPERGGHRAGLDAILLAATVDAAEGGMVADFGAGCGVAGLAVASRIADMRVDLIERDPAMAELARQSLSLPENTHVATRLRLIETDLTAKGGVRERAGLLPNAYQHIIANPPYNSPALQPSPAAARASAHVAPASLEPWVKSAAASLRAGGRITFILRPEALPDMMGATVSRFATLRIRPVHPRANRPASRILLRATKGTKAPLALLPPLVLHKPDGRWCDEVDAILRGRAAVHL